MNALRGIELHHNLPVAVHSVYALLRNRSEAELLAFFYEVAEALGIHVMIEAHALQEGGLREIWKWLGGKKEFWVKVKTQSCWFSESPLRPIMLR